MTSSHILGLDLGGTRLKAIALTCEGQELAREVAATDGENWLSVIRNVLSAFKSRLGDPVGIGIAAPGLPAADGRSIAFMPERLPGIEGLDWTAWLGSPKPVPVLNDAHAALLGEVAHGAALGVHNAVLITLGTGVGGAILCDGRLMRGSIGRAGHLGHMSLNFEGEPSIVGTPGAIEVLIGDYTVSRRSGGRFRTTRELVTAFNNGDLHAAQTWSKSIRALACAITSLINIVDPEIIILSGGITHAGDALLAPLRAELNRIEWRPGGHSVPIALSTLGDWAGAIGAACASINTPPYVIPRHRPESDRLHPNTNALPSHDK